ncbi:MAG TPA: sigma 54-interacting transcriptional regulator, partial [Polyangiaceae bacterium]|nr:sigma 54-interacting transcriptional regulator [Polyangiaceae bacterium]
MTGHSIAELLGQPMHDIVHHSHPDGRHYPRSECPIYAAFKDGMVRNVVDDVFWRKDGSCFPVEYTSTPIIAAGRLVGSVVVFRDVTLRKLTEDRLRAALGEVQRLKERLQEENRYLKQRIQQSDSASGLIENSPALRHVLDTVRRVATTDVTVLVTGESGTGKELVCRALHDLSPRRDSPFVSLNCAAIPATLIESELFGHERGAFTGASQQRIGRFELADGGTLFLDEIGELPLDAQAKLLRVVQQREFERIGGSRTLRSNARLVAATNRDLRELVRQGRFRDDLFYRLYVVPIHVPPLRERTADIVQLADHFRLRCEAKWGKRFKGIAPSCLEQLQRHDWPGNVRELEHAIERAALVCETEWLELPADLLAPSLAQAAEPQRLDDLEKQHIIKALERTNYRIAGAHGAAAALGLHPNTLRHRLKKLGLQRRP